MRPRPPSSPAMNSPGTFVSKFASMSGTVTRLTAAPVVTAMAPTGHPRTHSPCPLQSASFTTASLCTSVIAPGSGHEATHVPHPTHMSACTSARGAPVPALAAPEAGAFTSSKICCGTPQPGQNVEPFGTAAPHRAHGAVTIRGAEATASPPRPRRCIHITSPVSTKNPSVVYSISGTRSRRRRPRRRRG